MEGEIVDMFDDVMNEDSQKAEYGESSQQISEHGIKSPSSSFAHRKYHTFDGEIGYKKNDVFVPLTNFSVKCTGYVAQDMNATTAEGFLVDVVPKDSVKQCTPENQDSEQKKEEDREAYYLTWKDMSTQMGILGVISSTKLWTAPSKEQYLPTFFKNICDEYAASPQAHRVFPVQGLGLQKASGTPTWVVGSNFQVELVSGKARRLGMSQSPFCMIGRSGANSLPFYNIEGDLDSGKSLQNVITVQKRYMGENFSSALLVFGGMGLAVHFEQLSQLFGVPLVMAFGKPASGKSTAVEVAMSVIGQTDRTGECTLAWAMDMISQRSLPFWWDDAGDFSVLEKLAVSAFNKSNKKTAKSKAGYRNSARTVPLITMNPSTVSNVKKNKEKLSRTFSRIAVIPFAKLGKEEKSFATSLHLQAELNELMPELIRSVGLIIELSDDFAHIREDPLFEEVLEIIETGTELGTRTQCNYALLLYSTAKILEKIGMKEELFPQLKEWVIKTVLPHHQELVGVQHINDNSAEHGPSVRPMRKIILTIVEKAIAKPDEAERFFIPRYSCRKCNCGDVFGFNVAKALAFVRSEGQEDSLRAYIRTRGIGCNGVKMNGGKYVGSHIRTGYLPDELRVALQDTGKSSQDKLQGASERALSSTSEDIIPTAELPALGSLDDVSGTSEDIITIVQLPALGFLDDASGTSKDRTKVTAVQNAENTDLSSDKQDGPVRVATNCQENVRPEKTAFADDKDPNAEKKNVRGRQRKRICDKLKDNLTKNYEVEDGERKRTKK